MSEEPVDGDVPVPPPNTPPDRNNVDPPPPANNRTRNNIDPPPPDQPPPADDVEPLPAPCSDADRPDRCDQLPMGFVWDDAVLLDRLQIMGTDSNPECCFDVNGDGQIDNSYGINLAGFGFLEEVNGMLARAMSTGTPAIILEFEGLAPGGGPFRLNWWSGSWGPTMMGIAPSGNRVMLDGGAIDAGVQPHTYFTSATMSGSRIVATGGTIQLPMTFIDLPLGATTFRNVRLEADVTDTYPTLTGRLGGAVQVSDIFATVNQFVREQCDCLGLSQPLLEKQTGMCSPDADVQACEDSGDGDCANVGGSCNLYGALGLFADVDRDGDGLNDSISIGATFHGVPASIVGVED